MFCISADNIDGLMRGVFRRLLSGNRDNFKVDSKKGRSTEILSAVLELKNPRARISRSIGRSRVYSALGELAWYLAASDNLRFIEHYIPGYHKFSNDGIVVNGSYGPRIFSQERWSATAQDQWQRVIDTLSERPGSRNAVIQLFSNADEFPQNKDVPCTCVIQFFVRRRRVHMHTHMRSNDAFLGLPHDIFTFTMLQEIAARELGYELGAYRHSVSSLHLYDDNDEVASRTSAQRYLDEGLYESIAMPPMPLGTPWVSIREFIAAESAIRGGYHDFPQNDNLDNYWKDLIELLRIHAIASAKPSPDNIAQIMANLLVKNVSSHVYRAYILDRIQKKLRTDQNMADLFTRTREDA